MVLSPETEDDFIGRMMRENFISKLRIIFFPILDSWKTSLMGASFSTQPKCNLIICY